MKPAEHCSDAASALVTSYDRQALDDAWSTDPPANNAINNDGEPSIAIYAVADAEAKLRSLGQFAKDRDEVNTVSQMLNSMLRTGPFRTLRRLPTDWESRLERVAADFPNCEPLVDHLLSMCALCAKGDRVLSADPVLLVGPPGIGKTVVIEAVADIVGGGYGRIALPAAQSSGLLGGSEEYWSNSKPGAVFRLLVEGRHANPLVLLDEIDKATWVGQWSPLGTLYDLLEPATARRFVDLAVQGLPVDASRVLWFATANSLDPIPEPILRLSQARPKIADPPKSRVSEIDSARVSP